MNSQQAENATARDWSGHAAPTIDDFAALADTAFARLPEEFRNATGAVEFHILDFADDETLAALGIEDPFDLSGLYHGVDLRHRSLFAPVPQNSQIFLYRRPILDEWAERGDVTLGEMITHVLVHEIAHHLGLSDKDIHAIEDSD
jgi:predicted Zn-dependent protease with MMP-like domain